MSTPGAGRQVNVSPERLAGWLHGFAERHGEPTTEVTAESLTLSSPDRAQAVIALAWGPIPGLGDAQTEVVESMLRSRRVAALIVRRRGHAVGIFDGSQLLSGRHHGHYVQGHTKAGGWSQQRYARRRANQADRAYASAIEDAVGLLVPASGITTLATGGDQAGIEMVLADQRLARLRELPRLRVPGVPDPNAGVLASFADRFRAVHIIVNEYA
jgi:hypothetical protein